MALMRFTGAPVYERSRKGGLYAGGSADGNGGEQDGEPGAPARQTGGTPVSPSINSGVRGLYRLAAGTFATSGDAEGMVVIRPCVPVACAGTAAGVGAAAAAVSPSALRTSASSFAIVSLFSFRKARAFSRPCPMRSPL